MFMRINPKRGLVAAAGLAAGTVIAAGAAHAADQKTVKFGVPPWDGVTIKTAVVAEIIEPLGYEANVINASAPVIYQGLAKEDVHINMSAWSPGQAPTFMPHVRKGDVIKLAENLRGAIAGFAVPSYVYEAGLKRDTQLDAHGDKVDRTVYCIDPGSGANSVVNKAIENDVYGLGDWSISESSTAGMLSQVGKAVKNEEWIVFCGWKPHWMNVKYDMHYLEDPEDLWGPNGGESQVFTLITDSFQETHPALTTFFRRFQVDSDVQSRWIFEYAQKDRSKGAVAREWVKANMDTVSGWLDGLEARNGEPAAEVLRAALDDR